jgi:hypothetical protein
MEHGDLQTLHPMCEDTNYRDPEILSLFVNTGRNKTHMAVYHNWANVTPQIQISEGLRNFQRNVTILTRLPTLTQYLGNVVHCSLINLIKLYGIFS